MAILTEKTNESGVPQNYTKISKAALDGNRVTAGLKHFTSLQARIDGKSPVNMGDHDVVNLTLTAEEHATISGVLYGALKRHPEYVGATDQDPDEWKVIEAEPAEE